MTGFNSDSITEQVCLMMKGSTMLKAGRQGKPHFRKFQLSYDMKTLEWESPGKTKNATQVPIKNIESVLRGQKTKVFEGSHIPEYESISFSVMYKSENTVRSLDIVCKDRVEYEFWTVGLDALINGFEDVDAVHSIIEDIGGMTSKVSFDLLGDRVTVDENACDVYTWGSSPKGTLGHGEEEEELIPRAVEAMLGKDIDMVACATEHTMVTTASGEVFCWGSGRGGKLGMGDIQDHYMPLKVGSFSESTISYVACSELHSAAISSTGELYTFGRAGPWLGYSTKGKKQSTPMKVEELSNYTITKVSCGLKFTLALTSDGELFSFGENESGQLGLGHNDTENKPINKVDLLNDVKVSEISCGSSHAGVVTDNGEVYLWGANQFGQLGTGDMKTRTLPCVLNAWTVKEEKIKDIKCGGGHTIVLTGSGKIFCFGNGQDGQLGIDKIKTSCSHTPVEIPIPNHKVQSIDCGEAHTAAVTETGNLYTWGKGSHGRLGHADHADRSVPALVASVGYRRVESVSCGANHTAACVIQAWIKDEEAQSCMGCKITFTVIRRRHHCRKCGGIFCGPCTSHKIPILEIGLIDPVLVCDRCYTVLSEK